VAQPQDGAVDLRLAVGGPRRGEPRHRGVGRLAVRPGLQREGHRLLEVPLGGVILGETIADGVDVRPVAGVELEESGEGEAADGLAGGHVSAPP